MAMGSLMLRPRRPLLLRPPHPLMPQQHLRDQQLLQQLLRFR